MEADWDSGRGARTAQRKSQIHHFVGFQKMSEGDIYIYIYIERERRRGREREREAGG